MFEPSKLEILPYAKRFGLTPQLAALMMLLHTNDSIVTNEDIKDVVLQYGYPGKAQKRIVDMSIYRLRRYLMPYEIGIQCIEKFGAFFTEQDKKRISHALADTNWVQSA